MAHDKIVYRPGPGFYIGVEVPGSCVAVELKDRIEDAAVDAHKFQFLMIAVVETVHSFTAVPEQFIGAPYKVLV